MSDFDARGELFEAIEEFGVSPEDVLVDDALAYVEEFARAHGPETIRAQWDVVINSFSASGHELV